MNDYDLNLDSPGPEQSDFVERPKAKWNKPRNCKRCNNPFIPKHPKQAYCGCSKSGTTGVTQQAAVAVLLWLREGDFLDKQFQSDNHLNFIAAGIVSELAKNPLDKPAVVGHTITGQE